MGGGRTKAVIGTAVKDSVISTQLGLQNSPDIVQYQWLGLFIRVNAVSLEQAHGVRYIGHTFQEKWHKGCLVLFGNPLEQLAEIACIGRTVVGRHLHAHHGDLCASLQAAWVMAATLASVMRKSSPRKASLPPSSRIT